MLATFVIIFLFLIRFVTDIYRIMLSDKKYGLSVNIMATRVMPSLLPQTVNPSLNLEQFTILLEVGFVGYLLLHALFVKFLSKTLMLYP